MLPISSRLSMLLLGVMTGACSLHHVPFFSGRPIREQARNSVPKPAHAPRVAPTAPHVMTLDNNLTVYVLEKRGLPLVAATLVVRGGSAADPQGKEGLTSLMLETAKLGTTKRDAHTLAEEMESLGTSLEASTAVESIAIGTEALTDTLPKALDIVADVALHPKFAPEELKRAKAAHLAELKLLEGEPAAIGRRIARSLVFAHHPYGHESRGDARAVKAMTERDLLAQHQRIFDPARSALIFVGDIHPEGARTLAKKIFGGWSAKPSVLAPEIAEPPETNTRMVLVDRPNAPQAECAVVTLGVSRGAPEYPSLVLGNAVLGGMFNSRINMNLREEKGWTYGARSNLLSLRQRGLFSITSAIRTDVAADGVGEMLNEVAKLESDAISAEELRAAKNRHVLSVAGSMETVGRQSEEIRTLFVEDLPPTYYASLLQALDGVTEQDVLLAIRNQLPSSRMSVAVVGDKSKVLDKLLALKHGSVELLDASGQPVKATGAKVSSKTANASEGASEDGDEEVVENADDDEAAAKDDERRAEAADEASAAKH